MRAFVDRVVHGGWLRRAILVFALAAFLVLIVAGPAHVGTNMLNGHDQDHCSICAAMAVLHTVFVAVIVLLLLAAEDVPNRERGPREVPILRSRRWRQASPRAPPSFA